MGIAAEADCNISNNLIEAAAVFGILLGITGFTGDLLCNDDLIRVTPIGIGFSKESGTGRIFIASNMISGFTSDASHGAIVSVSYTGSGGYAMRRRRGGSRSERYLDHMVERAGRS